MELISSLRFPALIPQRKRASETWPGYYHSSRVAGLDYGFDEELRDQRPGLLQTLVNEFFSIVDFSEIVTEKKS